MNVRTGARLVRYLRPYENKFLRAKSSTRLRWVSNSTRQWSTPLAKTIAEVITTTGPISIAAYMRQCLTSPDGGYYTSRTEGKDQFGPKGDFITSPEISQVFGELQGIWLVTEWMAQGKISSGVEIIEVGPGRGTLMDDMLRTISNFRPLASSIESVYLVEASPSLRDAQKQLLCGEAPLKKVDIGFQSVSKYSQLPITWCEDIRLVPNEPSKTPFIFAHEFFDALPIHAFQSVLPNPYEAPNTLVTPTGPLSVSKPPRTPQWRELVVTPTPLSPPSIHSAPSPTISPPAEFQLSTAKASTPNSLLLPNMSSRYKALLSTPGSTIEISPESQSYVSDFAVRIGGPPPLKSQPKPQKSNPTGAALIFDYGPSTHIPTSTLRGIRDHKPVSPFASPGLVDISADVDFLALTEAALNASPGIEVHGPVEQGFWLESMGIRERAEMICMGLKEGGENSGDVAEARQRVIGAVERLVGRGPGGMGKMYKVLAIVPERGGNRPAGFGGGVEN